MEHLITTYRSESKDMDIETIFTRYNDSRVTFPPWQRYDNWTTEYKHVFIRSLLEAKDIPTIYLCKVPDDTRKTYILDGGHRTRAIVEYINGDFSIPLKDGNWYFFKQKEQEKSIKKNGRKTTTSQSLLLPTELQNKLKDSTIRVVTYSELTEKDSRNIFNELNHQRPMTNAEVVNAHSSLLVDNIRRISEQDESIVDDLVSLVPKFKNEKHAYYNFMIPMFSMTEIRDSSVLNHCEPKTLVKYIKGDGDYDGKDKLTHNTQFSQSEINTLFPNFLESLRIFREVLTAISPTRVNETGVAYSLFYYTYCNQDKDIANLSNNLKLFLDSVVEYKEKAKEIQKKIEKSQSKDISKNKRELEKLRSGVGEHIITWSETTKNNPCGPTNMKKRNTILSDYLS